MKDERVKLQYSVKIARLKRWIFFAQVVSACIVLFGIMAVILYLNPDLLNIPPGQHLTYRNKPIWLITGLLFIGLGIGWILIAHRRSRRSIWVYQNISPVPMFLTLEMEEDTDSTIFYAYLRDTRGTEPRWKAWVKPDFNARPLVGSETSVQVHIDPEFNTPAVIETDIGLLWANPFDPIIRPIR